MRLESLFVLGAVFLSAFAGRLAVLAAEVAEGPASASESQRPQCIDGAFAQELREQAERLEQAKLTQAERERAGEVILQHVNERLDELEKANAALAAAAGEALKKENEAAGKLASLYEKMKPEVAGGIIGGMDPAFAASLLLSMKGDSASAILGALDAQKAYAITVLMAEAT